MKEKSFHQKKSCILMKRGAVLKKEDCIEEGATEKLHRKEVFSDDETFFGKTSST